MNSYLNVHTRHILNILICVLFISTYKKVAQIGTENVRFNAIFLTWELGDRFGLHSAAVWMYSSTRICYCKISLLSNNMFWQMSKLNTRFLHRKHNMSCNAGQLISFLNEKCKESEICCFFMLKKFKHSVHGKPLA